MKKRDYYIIIFVTFGLIFISRALAISTEYVVPLKIISLFTFFINAFLLFSEIYYIKNPRIRLASFALILPIIAGVLFKVMHWPLSGVLVLGCGSLILGFLFYSAFNAKENNLFHYLVIAYFSIPLFGFVGYEREILYYLLTILCCALSVSAYLAFRKEEGKATK